MLVSVSDGDGADVKLRKSDFIPSDNPTSFL